MKTKSTFLSILFFLLFFSLAFAQKTATLKCDVAALQNGAKASEACRFAEAPDLNPEEFTLEVVVGEEITWSGEGSVSIKRIKHYRGTNVFAKDPEGNGTIKEKPNKPTDGKPYRYKIKFNIEGMSKNYSIDPIIKVKK